MTLVEKINEALDKGLTVQVCTAMRITPVKAKHRQQWKDAGFDFFKTDSKGSSYMIEGQKNGSPRYACIDFCRVKIF